MKNKLICAGLRLLTNDKLGILYIDADTKAEHMFSATVSDKKKLLRIYEVECTGESYRFPQRSCGYHNNIEDITLWRAAQNQAIAYLDEQKLIKKLSTSMITDLNEMRTLYRKSNIYQRRALVHLIQDFLDG